MERVDRRLDRAGLAREVALGRADHLGSVALNLRELRLQPADPAAGVQVRQSVDGVLQAGSVRTVSWLAAASGGRHWPDRRGNRARNAGPRATWVGTRPPRSCTDPHGLNHQPRDKSPPHPFGAMEPEARGGTATPTATGSHR